MVPGATALPFGVPCPEQAQQVPEVVHDDGSSRLLRWRNAVVQLRRGELTRTTLELVREKLRSLPRPTFVLVILEQDATIPNAELRSLQIDILNEVRERPDVHVAVVIEGNSARADLRRMILRSAAFGKGVPFPSVERAAEVLATEAGAPTAEDFLMLVRAARFLPAPDDAPPSQ